ncbi:MAG: DUF1559 domain-containing protein, partial [Planctomycetota bacterium]|nr:DUF1559 domain-containing protein [Planctomycetota bacterium]
MSDDFENEPELPDAASSARAPRPFTLGRLLLAGAIVVLLIALFLPAVRTSRSAARRAQCVNNMREIALALHNYELAYEALPPAYTADAHGRPLHSWRTLILPYLEQEELYRTIDLAKPWNDPANAAALGTSLAVYHCPESRAAPNTTTYLAIAGPNDCLIPRTPRRLAEITDPRESTLMVIEAGEENA